MNRLEKSLAAIAAVLAIALGVLWLKPGLLSGELRTGAFADTAALADSPWAKSDLIPAWLPAAASELRIAQISRSGAGYLAFRFPAADLAELREACPRILKPLPELPQAVAAELRPAKPDAFHLCPQGVLAIDGAQGRALLWR